MKIITSADNNEIKEAKKLHETKYRKETELFFFEGIHLLEEFLKMGKKPYRIFLTEKCENLYEDSEEKRVISQRLYDKITAENAPQGIFTVAKWDSVGLIRADEEKILEEISGCAVVLESMRDPGNVGTVIRTAVSLGVPVIFTEDSADIFNPKVIRASMGAVFADNIYIVPSATSLAKKGKEMGFNVFGTLLDENAQKVGSFEIPQKSIFIIGNEGAGIKAETAKECGEFAYIPMTGKTESLNAATAASIILWEIAKARGN